MKNNLLHIRTIFWSAVLLAFGILPIYAITSNGNVQIISSITPQPSGTNPQADLLIKGSTDPDSNYQIDNVYQQDPTGEQIKTIASLNKGPVRFNIKMQNDSTATQTYILKAEESADSGYTINYTLDDGSRFMTTYAGGGTLTADGTDRKSYQIDYPLSLAYSHKGELYIGCHNKILRIDASGKVYTVTATDGYVTGLAFSGNDSLLFTEAIENIVKCIDLNSGAITTIAGTGTAGYSGDGGSATNAQICWPYGIAVDSSGNIYFCDRGNSRVRKVDAVTKIITTIANISDPVFLMIDSNNSIYVDDCGIKKISGGSVTPVISTNPDYAYNCASCFCIGKDSKIYYAPVDYGPPFHIYKCDLTGSQTIIAGNGNHGFSGDDGPAVMAEYECPYGLAARDDGAIMICDPINSRIRMVEPENSIQDVLATTGLTTPVAAGGSILVNATITPNTVNRAIQKSIVFKAYSDNTVMDSVEALANAPFVKQPDLLIKNQVAPDSSYQGDSIYQQNPSDPQIFNQDLQPGEPAYFSIKLQNKGDVTQSFLLKSLENNLSGWVCSYSMRGTDITSDIIGNGYTTPILDPGNSLVLDVTETPDLTVVGEIPETATVSVFNDATDTTVEDSVTASATVHYGPDLLIKAASDPDSAYQIPKIYQTTPDGNQIKTLDCSPGSPDNFSIQLCNDCELPTGYYLKSVESADTGWTVKYSLNNLSRIITTYAGGGNSTLDGTDSISYKLPNPICMAYDSLGDLYIGGNCYIWKIGTDGKAYKVAGNGTNDFSGDGNSAVNASITDIEGMAFDSSNNLYFTDSSNQRVRRIDAITGKITTIAGNGTARYSGDSGQATASSLNYPKGIALDSSGNIYVSDTGNNRIRKIDAVSNLISTFAGTGSTQYNGDNISAAKANFHSPAGIAFDSSGNLYIAELNGFRLRKVNKSNGLVETVAGMGSYGHDGDSSLATQAHLYYPISVSIGSDSNIYFSEKGDGAGYYVRMIDSKTGIITSLSGDESFGFSGDGLAASTAEFNDADGIIIKEDGSILVADYGNNRIRMIESDTVIQSELTAGGYKTDTIPAHGNIIINVVMTPDSTLPNDSKKSVVLQVYKDDSDPNILDSVEAIAQVFAQKTYATSAGFIRNGWNLISLPTDPVSSDIATVFTGIDVANSSFQYWNNAADPCAFQVYGSAFGWTGPAVRGVPYWFVQTAGTSNTVITYQGTEPVTDFIMTLPAHTSAPYWIAIGTPFPSAVSADNIQFKDVTLRGDTWLTWNDAYSSANSALRVVDSSMQGWDNSQGSFIRLAPSTFAIVSDKTQFDPWWGYWMLAMDKNELQIKFPKPVQ